MICLFFSPGDVFLLCVSLRCADLFSNPRAHVGRRYRGHQIYVLPQGDNKSSHYSHNVQFKGTLNAISKCDCVMVVYFSLSVYISWRFGGKCRCGVRLLHRCSLHWVWVTALWSLTRPTILCITTATGMPSWSQASTSWPQYWPLWLSLWSSVSEPRTLLWIVLRGNWESVHFIFDLSP